MEKQAIATVRRPFPPQLKKPHLQHFSLLHLSKKDYEKRLNRPRKTQKGNTDKSLFPPSHSIEKKMKKKLTLSNLRPLERTSGFV